MMIVKKKKNWSTPKMKAVQLKPFLSRKAEIRVPNPGAKMLRMKRMMCMGGSTYTIAASHEPVGLLSPWM